MMTVVDIIEQRRRQAFGYHLGKWIEERGMSKGDFLRAVYGRDDGGKTKGAGSLYNVLNGSGNMTQATLERWCTALNIETSELLNLYDLPAPPDLPEPVAIVKKKAPAAKKAVAGLPVRPPPPPPPPPPPAAADDQFSLVISHSGRASLRLNLLDIPMQDAMKAMGALTAAGILHGPEGH